LTHMEFITKRHRMFVKHPMSENLQIFAGSNLCVRSPFLYVRH